MSIRRFAATAVPAVLMLAASSALAEPYLFVTTDAGVVRYDFATDNHGTLIPESGDAFSFMGIDTGPDGNLYFATTGPLPQVYRYDPASGLPIGSQPFVFYQGMPPSPDPHDIIDPRGLGFSPITHNLYVADISGSTANVHIYDSTGSSVGALTDPNLNQPGDVAFDASGNMYVVNPGAGNVMVSAGGIAALTDFTVAYAGELINPTSLTFGPDGRLYVLDSSTDTIVRFNADGTLDGNFLTLPLFEAADIEFGSASELYVSGLDLATGSGEIIRLAADGTYDGTRILTGLTNPRFMAFVPAPGSGVLLAGGLGLTARRQRKSN